VDKTVLLSLRIDELHRDETKETDSDPDIAEVLKATPQPKPIRRDSVDSKESPVNRERSMSDISPVEIALQSVALSNDPNTDLRRSNDLKLRYEFTRCRLIELVMMKRKILENRRCHLTRRIGYS
jgi:hypothetical protein